MNKKQRKQSKVAMVVALVAISVAHSTGGILAQNEPIMEESNSIDIVENKTEIEDLESPVEDTEGLESIVENPLENSESIQNIEKAVGDVEINETNFPDPAFREFISTIEYDTNSDGVLSSDEINRVTWISPYPASNITSLEGVQYFPNLVYLECANANITNLDVSKNPALEYLDCYGTKITNLDLSNNPALTSLSCDNTGITNLDLSNNPALTRLSCSSTGITNLDVSKNPALISLQCSDAGLTSLDVSNNPALTYLACVRNKDLTSLIVNGAVALATLRCQSTGITSLDVSNNPALGELACSDTGITNLDVSNNPALWSLDIYGSNLAWMNIGDRANLFYIGMSDSKIDLGKVEDTFNIKERFPGIDVSKIMNINGANLDPSTGVVSGYTFGTPITYTYDCGTRNNGVAVTLDVTLNFNKKKKSSSIIINDNLNKVYDGQVAAEPLDIEVTGSTGAISIEWYTADDKKLDEAPVNVGSYKVKVILVEDINYNGVEVEKEFDITKANNQWVQELSIENWVYGETANTPSAEAQFGIAEFTYSTTENGIYTADVPSTAGTYWVKATVTGINNYDGLVAKKSFTIEKASSVITIDNDLNKIFDGATVVEPQVTITGSTGAVSVEWYQKEETTTKAITWKKLATAPSAVGEYKVVVTVGADENYIETTKEQEFSILENKVVVPTPAQGVIGVQTGDSTQAGLWTMLVGLSTGFIMYFRKKNKKEEV